MKQISRPISGGTNQGSRPSRYHYWRTGFGTPLPQSLEFWVQQAGEYHCRINHITGDFEYNPGSVHFFYQTAGTAVLEFGMRAVWIKAGDLFVLPANTQFYYRAQEPLKYHWFVLEGQWPALIADNSRWLSIGEDDEVVTKFSELREVLILQPPGYALLAISLVFALMARLTDISDSTNTADSQYPEAVRNAMLYLRENYDLPFDAPETANAVGVSPSYLRLLFEKWVGESPQQYHTGYRIAQAKRLLSEQTLSIGEIALQIGFTDARYFSRVFKQTTGLTPSQYAQQSQEQLAADRPLPAK